MFRNGINVTDEYPATAFNWTRDSGNEEADAAWDAAHMGMKSVVFNLADPEGMITISCSLTAVSPTYGTVQVDMDTMMATCTPGTSASTLSYSNGVLSATVQGATNPYTLVDGTLYARQYLNGTITATENIYPYGGHNREIEFTYNHAGLRVEKVFTDGDTVTTTKYTLNGANVVGMTVTNTVSDEIVSIDTMHFYYDAQNQPAMVDFNGVVYSYVKNLQGDIVGLLDSNGSLVVEYYYDAWGKPLLTRTLTTEYEKLANLNPFRYRGYVYDEETELYYLRSRYYNPTIARFINADNLSESLTSSLFAYCLNSVIRYADYDGTRCEICDSGVSTGYEAYTLNANELLIFSEWLSTQYELDRAYDPFQKAASNILKIGIEEVSNYVLSNYTILKHIPGINLIYGVIVEAKAAYENYEKESAQKALIKIGANALASLGTNAVKWKIYCSAGAVEYEFGIASYDADEKLVNYQATPVSIRFLRSINRALSESGFPNNHGHLSERWTLEDLFFWQE